MNKKPDDKELERRKKNGILFPKTSKDPILIWRLSDVTLRAPLIASFFETGCQKDKIIPFYFASFTGYTWDAGI